MGERFFFRFQILLSHNNNHLTAPCGLAAASNVEREKEKGGGGGEAHAAGQWPTPSGQWPIPYITTQHTDGSPITPRFALSVRHRVLAHTYAFHLSIPGPNLGQVLLNIPGNILTEKAKHKLEGKIKNNAGAQGHSLKA